MRERLSKQDLIDDADRTIANLIRLRNDYFDELYDEYLKDVDHAILIIETWRGILDGSVF